jgi:peptide/nickel transport system substrate-binding protein
MLGRGSWSNDVVHGFSARRTATKAVATLALAAAGLVAAGCGSSGDKSSGGSVTSGRTGAVGEVLTIATPNVPASLDPATGANENADYFDLAYDPLIVQAPDGSFKPGLATSWQYGPRNMSFSIALRSGVKFSDGTPLDAEAVKTWINHAMDLPGGRAPTYLKNLDSIKVQGPLRLELEFTAPTPLLELIFSQRLEMGMVGSPKAVAAKTLATSTAGTGPYMLDKARSVTGDHYTYVPNPHYWNKEAVRYKRAVIKKIDNPTAALQALKTGQVQVVKDQPVTSIAAAKRAGLRWVAPETLLMGLSLLDRGGKLAEPLGDVRVRQAINHAIDRKSVANVIGAGHGRPTAQMAVPGDDSYDEALDESYPYDAEKAKALLAQAGYAKGFTLPTIATTVVGQDKLGQAIAGQLSKVGINLKLDVKPAVADYIKQMSTAAAPSATLGFGRLPATINYQLLWGPDAATFNPFKTTDPKLDDLNEQLSAAPTADAPAIARQMQGLIVEEAWFAPVVATPLVVLHRPDVTGVTAGPKRPMIYAPEIAPSS